MLFLYSSYRINQNLILTRASSSLGYIINKFINLKIIIDYE